jgi:hypothetical protein
MSLALEFIPEWDDRVPWKKVAGAVTSIEVLKGHEGTGLSVVVAESIHAPNKTDIQALWKTRAGKSADPVLVCVQYTDHGQQLTALLGLTNDAVPVSPVERALAERLIAHALTIDSPLGLHADMRRRLSTLVGGVGPGFRNEGLFATHVLEQQTDRADWGDLCGRSKKLLASRGDQLLTGLGYSIEPVKDGMVLRDASDGSRRAAAVLLSDDESFDNPLSRFHGSNAVTHGLALARREGVDWLIVHGGTVVRLFPVDPDIGVGRKGQTQTFAEVDLTLLTEDKSGYLALLFSPQALNPGGIVWQLLGDSSRWATALSDRLRDRIYEDVIPTLAVGMAGSMHVTDLPKAEQRAALDEAYHRAMIVLFRLLFVAYAEDRGFLPYGVNDTYTSNALKTLGRRILDEPEQGFSKTSTSMWADLVQVWDVIDSGDIEGMGVPAYNGGLFTRDAVKNPSGAATYDARLTNAEIGPVLRGLLIDQTTDGVLGPVDFRALDVREFGTIYEGLLASGLGIAETDLTLDTTDTYVPAEAEATVVVPEGGVYFHSRSGSRKATGSYFTKPFAVQHLLDTALEPTLTEHLTRVEALITNGATRSAAIALFDFRVADISMGSAHFLVAAIDRIEARFTAFLAENPLPEVAVELHSLRTQAAKQLNLDPADTGIDDAVLLRRQIARRCIYGVDINEIAVELARLAVWIHTFVPGLPLSFLNHGLVHGNSLTGVGTLDEIVQALNDAEQRETKTAGDSWLLPAALAGFMDRAGVYLDQLATLADASIADVTAANEVQTNIQAALAPLAALCDLITAERTTRHLKKTDPQKILLSAGGGKLFAVAEAQSLEAAILSHPQLAAAQEIARTVSAAHLPVLYPEVFRREPSGFDVILGNPPWEKMKVEEDGWWGARFPGLLSMPQAEKNEAIRRFRDERPDLVIEFEAEVFEKAAAAQILTAGPYPGIGATDIELAAAFCWRFWHLIRDTGLVGVVLPRTALAGAATAEWRRVVLNEGGMPDATLLLNNRHWAFQDIHPQYTIGLVTVGKMSEHLARLRGPYASLEEFNAGMADPGDLASVTSEQLAAWSGTMALPLLPARDLDLFAVMKQHPPLGAEVGDWAFRPVTELHTTKEKRFYDFNLSNPSPSYTLPVWTGGTFNIWDPGGGDPYAYAEPEAILELLQARRVNQIRLKSSAFYGLSEAWAADVGTLPMNAPRIAFRDVTNRTNTRTVICCLVPPGVALVHKAPFLFQQAGRAADEAFLLGVMSSVPFDWFARRFVELSMTFQLLITFPVPRIGRQTGRLVALDGSLILDSGDLRPIHDRIVGIAGRLAAVDDRYSEWALMVGVEVGSVKSPAEKDALICELDALVSLLYGLSRDQVSQLFASFHRGWDYKPRLARVLEFYDEWSKKVSA